MSLIREDLDLGQTKYILWGSYKGVPRIREAVLYKIELKKGRVSYCFDPIPSDCIITLYADQLEDRMFGSLGDAEKHLLIISGSMDNVVLDGVGDYVYLVGCGEFIKIGITKDPNNRFREYTKLPYEPYLYAMFPFVNAKEVEKKLHSLFSYQRARGEWFRVNPTLVVEALRREYEQSGEAEARESPEKKNSYL